MILRWNQPIPDDLVNVLYWHLYIKFKMHNILFCILLNTYLKKKSSRKRYTRMEKPISQPKIYVYL